MLEAHDHIEENLQQDCSEDRDRERVDHNRIHVLHEEVEDDGVDEHIRRPREEDLLLLRDGDGAGVVVVTSCEIDPRLVPFEGW